jgi:hypothetical protein
MADAARRRDAIACSTDPNRNVHRLMRNPKRSRSDDYLKHAEAAQREVGVSLTQQVMSILGLPAELQGVQVRHLWGDRFRVNVLVGADATTATVAHSFFLAVGEDGLIAESSPPVTRKYGHVRPSNPGD